MTMDAKPHMQVDVAECLVYLPLQMSSPTMLYIVFPGLIYFTLEFVPFSTYTHFAHPQPASLATTNLVSEPVSLLLLF